MRKQLKNKRRSCALCKPHKTGHSNRWKPKEKAAQKTAAQQILEAFYKHINTKEFEEAMKYKGDGH